MAYSPPVGSVTLNLCRPVGSVTLSLHDPSSNRSVAGAARTAGATGAGGLIAPRFLTGAARTAGTLAAGVLIAPRSLAGASRTAGATAVGALIAPHLIDGAARTASAAALASISTLNRLVGAARTAGVMAHGSFTQSLNLPPLLAASSRAGWRIRADIRSGAASGGWQEASPLRRAGTAIWTEAPAGIGVGGNGWQEASPLRRAAGSTWMDAPQRMGADWSGWREASPLRQAADTAWTDAPRRTATGRDHWAAVLPRLIRLLQDAWATAAPARAMALQEFWGDGPALRGWKIGRWSESVGPANTRKAAISPPPGIRPPRINWATPIILNLHRPLTQGMPIILNLSADPRPFARAPVRRVYRMLTSLQIVRLPDRTPLPATSLSLQTDFDSWGWSLDLSLAGPDGWALCQPVDGLPVECEITINGVTWAFMLNDPQLARKFESGYSVSVHGISRAGWLTTPWAPSETIQYENDRSARQIADEALDGTGWALGWELPDDPQWLIPGGTYARTGTILERIQTLVAAVNGGLYCDPALYVMTARPRYPVPPWQWDSTPPEISIPEAALLSWNQSPDPRPSINRVYTGGTTHGVLLQLTRTGTAGDRCPNEPILDALLTDVYAARARGMADLSGGGPGFSVTVETLLGGGVPLVRPGDLVEFAGLRGINRATRIRIESAGGLAVGVIQELTLERRIGPWQ